MSAPKESKEGLSSLQIVFLVIAGFLLLIALGAGFSKVTAPAEDTSADERIAPVASVATEAAAPAAAANAGNRTGEELFKSACINCHGSGLLGSPKAHDKAAWMARLGGDAKALAASAVKGKNSMPPKGGVADATEAELQRAIEFMMK